MKWSCIVLVLVLPCFAQKPKTSQRSKKAVAKVRPQLEKQLADLGASWGASVFLRLFKGERQLEVWVETGEVYKLMDTYPICYFSGELGPKKKEGDLQAPEGFYRVTPSLMNPWSSYHLSFNVGYPNRFDRAQGYTGSLIMIHGNCVSIGCFAMTDPSIERIYAMVEASLIAGNNGVPVHIFPFRMSQKRLEAHANSPHIDFWRQLLPGYLFFESQRKVPKIRTRGKSYVLEPH